VAIKTSLTSLGFPNSNSPEKIVPKFLKTAASPCLAIKQPPPPRSPSSLTLPLGPQSMPHNNVLIFGAGAIGAFYGSRLALVPSLRVSVVCRSNFAAVSQHGFRIESPQYGNTVWRPHQVFGKPADAKGQWDWVVVSTKALPDVSDDSALLEGIVGEGTRIVLIQNGLGVEEPYVRRFPVARVMSAVTIASCAQPESGRVVHNRWTRINVAPYRCEGGEEFVGWLNEAGVKDAKFDSEEKMQMLRWHKVAINAAMNPSSVLSGGAPNVDMARDEEMQRHLSGVMDEVLRTAPKVVGIPMPKEYATSEQILRSTQKNSSGSVPSMQQDWAAGKKMELEVILGAPIRIAREKGIEMPRLQSLYALIKMRQQRRDGGAKL
jgi:2-dehydropantoate 2-reductase